MLHSLAMRPGFRRRLRTRGRRGLAILDVVLAIGAIGIAIGGAVALFMLVAQERQKRTDTTRLINQVRAGMDALFETSGSYLMLDMRFLYNRGKVSDSVWNGTSFNHSFGNDIAVFPMVPGGQRFWLGLRGLDEDACEYMLGTYAGMTQAHAGIVLARVDATPGTPGPALTQPAGADGAGTGTIVSARMPYTLADVDAACDAGDGEHNIWYLFG